MQENRELRHESRSERGASRSLRGLPRIVAWLCLMMAGLALLIVILRAGTGFGRIWLQELVVWLHVLLFFSGGILATIENAHVRIELWRECLRSTYKIRLEMAGHLILLLPMALVLFWTSLEPVARAWRSLEASPSVGGMPGLFLLKTALPLTALALVVWSFQQLLRRRRGAGD